MPESERLRRLSDWLQAHHAQANPTEVRLLEQEIATERHRTQVAEGERDEHKRLFLEIREEYIDVQGQVDHLRRILATLVRLKDEKATREPKRSPAAGKNPEYQREKAMAWDEARSALAASQEET